MICYLNVVQMLIETSLEVSKMKLTNDDKIVISIAEYVIMFYFPLMLKLDV